jgi:hypothetical protein
MNQLGDLVAGDSFDASDGRKLGTCHRYRPWLRFWLECNPLTHLVQEFKFLLMMPELPFLAD